MYFLGFLGYDIQYIPILSGFYFYVFILIKICKVVESAFIP